MSSLGTEFKINVHVEPIDGLHMSDYDFTCVFYIYGKGNVSLNKSDMIRVDEDNYIACIDSGKLGVGVIMMRITAQIPDADFPNFLRTEVQTISTDIIVTNKSL